MTRAKNFVTPNVINLEILFVTGPITWFGYGGAIYAVSLRHK